MKRIFIALALIVSTPVLADNSQGEGALMPSAGMSPAARSFSGTIYPAPKAKTDIYNGLDWNRDGTFAATPGVTTPAAELAKQVKRNEAARGRYDDYGNAPFEYSAAFVRAFQQGGSE